jgi:hypothetical protein
LNQSKVSKNVPMLAYPHKVPNIYGWLGGTVLDMFISIVKALERERERAGGREGGRKRERERQSRYSIIWQGHIFSN